MTGGMVPDMQRISVVVAVSVLLSAVLAVEGQRASLDYTGWRTDGLGTYPDALPFIDWEGQAAVVWSNSMPGVSNSTPVISGDRLFTCAEPSTLLCLSISDGSIVWERTNSLEDLPEAADVPDMQERHERARELRRQINQARGVMRKAQADLKDDPDDADAKARLETARESLPALQAELKPYTDAWYSLPDVHPLNGFTSATPACDGEHVYMVFATGLVVCYDLDGNRIWARVVAKPTIDWGHSASPVISGEVLIVQISGMKGLDKRTGETRWEADVPDSWGTALVTNIGQTPVVVSPSGSVVRPSDGAVLGEKLSKVEFAGPVMDGDVVYFPEWGGKAIRMPEDLNENPPQFETLWTTEPNKERYYASAVVADGLLYACTRYQVFSCIDAADGSIVYEQNLNLGKGEVYPSVTLAGGLLIVGNDSGSTVIIRPGRTYEEVSRQRIEAYRGSPVFIGDRVYIRGLHNMLCLGPGGGG